MYVIIWIHQSPIIASDACIPTNINIDPDHEKLHAY